MSDKKKIVVWSTKYALTCGVEKLEATETGIEGMVDVGRYSCLHGEGRD